jgi:predicted heme/steroid binding protein
MEAISDGGGRSAAELAWACFLAGVLVVFAVVPIWRDWAASRRSVSLEELAKHCSSDDAWMAVQGIVYDVTNYISVHPGGKVQLLRGAGKDSTALFFEAHPQVGIMSGDDRTSFIRIVGHLSRPISGKP